MIIVLLLTFPLKSFYKYLNIENFPKDIAKAKLS